MLFGALVVTQRKGNWEGYPEVCVVSKEKKDAAGFEVLKVFAGGSFVVPPRERSADVAGCIFQLLGFYCKTDNRLRFADIDLARYSASSSQV